MKNIIKLNEVRSGKYKDMAEIVNLGLSLSKKINRNILINKLLEQYDISNILSDVLETFMCNAYQVANDIYYMMTGKEVELEPFVPRTNAVTKDCEFNVDALNEVKQLMHKGDPLLEEVQMYTELVVELMQHKQKVEMKIKRDLLSSRNLEKMKAIYKEELGVEVSRREIKKQLQDLFKKYDMRYLIENDYISI